jgi:hypothetical protein
VSTPSSSPRGGRRHAAGPSALARCAFARCAFARCAFARRAFARCAFLALGLVPAIASAQVSDVDKSTARALAQQGQNALTQRDFATAADRFARAAELVHAPTLGLGLARAQVGLGQWIAAAETYRRVLREPLPASASAAFTKAFADARRELAELEPRIPVVTLAVRGAPAARVTLDGTPVPGAALGVGRPVDPGKHAVRAEAEGFAPAQAAFTAEEHKSEAVTLTLERAAAAPEVLPPPPPPLPPPATAAPRPEPGAEPPPSAGPVAPEPPSSSASLRRTLGFVGLGLGGAGIVLGAVSGGLAIPKHSALQTACPGGRCPESQANALGSYHVLTNLSTGGFIAGGVLAAAGMVLVISAPRAPASASAGVTPVIGAGYAGAEGWF